jgi:hypothetical protein
VGERSNGRLLAGLVSYGRSEKSPEPVEVSDALQVLGTLANDLLASRKTHEQWSLLLSGRAFADALERRATETLAKERSEHALSWFNEHTLVNLDGAAFRRLADEEACRREARVLETLGLTDAAADDAFLQVFRRRLLTATLWEKSVRALPAVFLLVAAVVALSLLMRVLKLPA